ncbi:biotin transporter BioY [Actinotalea sp. K2]|uniref:biotin transporter BioY n=1 Tax=Actinotalea sp. K2 TaxID=2939438 RepID=UPI0020170470|nr:biotin transporter BioY [Actinotalea sp. K2]MCL3861953.1 biotin transporter BioY [Actinotalea sp. K2]
MPVAPENDAVPAAASRVPVDPDAGGRALPVPVLRSSAATDVALIATFAAFVAVCALLPSIAVPNLAVPITLQTFGVMLAGVVLGPRRGSLAVLLYLAVGLAGLPVFAQGTGGLAVLGKPSLGYLLAFPLAAGLAGLLVGRARSLPTRWLPVAIFGACAAGSLLLTHPIGISVMGARLGMGVQEAIAAGATFLPGDVLKNVLVAVVATAVFRAFPDLLQRRP